LTRPSAVARQAADVTCHDTGSPVSWNGNFTDGFAVAPYLTCAATLTMAESGIAAPRRKTYNVAQACGAYSQARLWPPNQKPGRPAAADALPPSSALHTTIVCSLFSSAPRPPIEDPRSSV